MYGVRGVFAEYERVKIAERFRLGKIRKAKEGHIVGTQAPYGYTYILRREGQQGYYEINDSEAQVVRKIFSFVANEGITIRKLAKRLLELNVPPRKSARGVWNTSTLCTLLRNKTYIGEAHYGASYAVLPEKPRKLNTYRKIKKTGRKIRPETEWIKISTPAIVDRALFMRAQQQLKENFKMARRNKKNHYLLAGKIRCTCGCTRAGEGPKHGNYLYYRCASRVNSYPLPPTCAEGGINARVADSLVWSEVVRLMSSKELMLKQVQRWAHNQPTKATSLEEEDIDLRGTEISKLQGQMERYTKAYGAGLVSLEELKSYTVPLREKISALEGQLADATAAGLQEKEGATPPEPRELEAFARKAAKALQHLNFDTRREIVGSVVEKVVGRPGELQVYGYVPLEGLNHVELCSINRNSRSPQCWQINAF